MFRSKTLFILGAGSSAEAEMPDGDKLKVLISEKLNIRYDSFGVHQESGDRGIARSLSRYAEKCEGEHSVNVQYQIQKAQSLRKALPHAISVDNLLDAHRGDDVVEICGKLGIFQSILESERRSNLFYREVEEAKLEQLSKTWFSEFIQLLVTDVPKKEIKSIFKNLKIINFNYDRCFEQYLVPAIMDYYAMEIDDVVEILGTLEVLRPYGCIGDLQWKSEGSNCSISFGSDIFQADNNFFDGDKGTDLLNSAMQIKTFNEKQHNPDALKSLHDAVREAQTIVFLGFAFHRQNLELLKFDGNSLAKNIFATRFGVSGSNWDIIQRDLIILFGKSANILHLNAKCSELLKEFSRIITS